MVGTHTVTCTWRGDQDFAKEGPKLRGLFQGLSLRARLACVAGMAEWVYWRHADATGFDAPLMMIEAAWAANLDIGYVDIPTVYEVEGTDQLVVDAEMVVDEQVMDQSSPAAVRREPVDYCCAPTFQAFGVFEEPVTARDLRASASAMVPFMPSTRRSSNRQRLAECPSAVLLVDGLVDSDWTMTVTARLLRQAGAPAVLPLALALAG